MGKTKDESKLNNWRTSEPISTGYSMIRQGTSTNALTKMEVKNENIDKISGMATVTSGGVTLAIMDYSKLKGGLRQSVYQLLDTLTAVATEHGFSSPTVKMTLDEYMLRRGLRDRKEAKSRLIEDIKALSGARLTWEEKKGKKTESFSFVSVADHGEVKRNGDITFTFGQTLFDVMRSYKVMPYPQQLLTIKTNRFPCAYPFLRKILEFSNMNVGKANADRISVKTLLEVSGLPTYEEVMKGNKNVQSRIIDPFEKNLDALEDTLSWEYCHSKGAPLTQEELDNMNYKIFESLLIHITLKNYPDQTQRIERKKKAIATSKKRTETNQKQTRKKNKPIENGSPDQA